MGWSALESRGDAGAISLEGTDEPIRRSHRFYSVVVGCNAIRIWNGVHRVVCRSLDLNGG